MADAPNINDFSVKLQQFAERTLKIESSSSRIDAITKSIAAQYGSMAQKNAVVGLGFTRLTGGMTTKSKEMAELQQLLTKALVQQNNVMARRERLMDATLNIQTKIDRATRNPKTNNPETLMPLQKQLDATTGRIVELDQETGKLAHQIEFLRNVAQPAATEIGRLGTAAKALGAGVFVTGIAQLLVFSHELNRSVIQTNSSLAHRQDLLDASLSAQVSIGASSKVLLDVQHEMVSIGARIYDQQTAASAQALGLVGTAARTKKEYQETLKTAVMLVEGLGASAHEAVQLQITARATNANYRDVANTISKIVGSTGLAADEAIRYARALTVASRISLGGGARFNDQVFKRNLLALSSIEGAMKDSIGVQGEIANLLVKFSSFQKLGGLGATFGTGGIDFLQRQGDQVGKVVGNIARTVQNASGPLLEAYANMLELSPETLVALGHEYKKAQQAGLSFEQYYAERQKLFAEDSDLQERYNRQLSLQGETFSRLGKVMVVLAGEALAPLLRGLNWFSTKLMGLFKLIGPDGPLGPIAGWLKTGFGVIATGFLVTRLWDVTRALFAFTASLIRLSSTLQKSSIENTIASIAGGKSPGKSVVRETVKDVAQIGLTQKIMDMITGGFGRVKGLFTRPRTPAQMTLNMAIEKSTEKNGSLLRTLFGKLLASVGVLTAAVKSLFASEMLRGLFSRIGGIFGGMKDSVKGLFGRGSKQMDLPLKAESSAMTGFFRNLMGSVKGFFGKIFGKTVAVEAAETVTATASRGIVARVLASVGTFFGGTFIRGVLGRVLMWILGIVGGVPGLIIGLVLTLVPLLWPKIKSLFGTDKEKTIGAGISVEDMDRKAINGFLQAMLTQDGKRLEITEKAYQSLIKIQGKTPEELQELNARIVAALDRKIEVTSGSAQREQGIDKAKDVANAKAINEQIKFLSELTGRLDNFTQAYKANEIAKKKAAETVEEERRRKAMTDLDVGLSNMMANPM
jgi:hypothetical protein